MHLKREYFDLPSSLLLLKPPDHSLIYSLRVNVMQKTNVNFNKKSFGDRLTEYQLVAFGFTGFPFRKKVGLNFELAYGGPYIVKAGIVFGL